MCNRVHQLQACNYVTIILPVLSIKWKREKQGLAGYLISIIASCRLMPISLFCSSRNLVSQVFNVTNFAIVHVAWQAHSLSISLWLWVLSTESILGTRCMHIWSGNWWLMLALPAYSSISWGLAARMSILSMYMWSAWTWFYLGIFPCIPSDTIFQCNPTSISSMNLEISVFIFLLKKSSQPMEIGDSVCMVASQRLNLDSWANHFAPSWSFPGECCNWSAPSCRHCLGCTSAWLEGNTLTSCLLPLVSPPVLWSDKGGCPVSSTWRDYEKDCKLTVSLLHFC